MMSSQGGSLSTLLKYRFTKKVVPKLSSSHSEQNGITNGHSQDDSSQDSQASGNSSKMVNGFSDDSQDCSTQESIPSKNIKPGPWLSKSGTTTEGNSSSNFKRIKRPVSDSDEERMPVVKPPARPSCPGINETWLARLREMFPDCSENRMRAALILHPKDFDRAAEFMKSDNTTTHKRKDPEPLEGSKNYKRIKIDPESPGTPRVVDCDFLKEPKKETNAIDFLRGCFPNMNTEDIRNALSANNWDAELTAAQLSSEKEGSDIILLEDEAAPGGDAGTSSKTTSASSCKPAPQPKPAPPKQKKEKAKRKDVDLSDEDEVYDEFDDSGDSDDSEDFGSKSKSEIDCFLQFFEEATLEELTALPGCSKKKAESILNLRPFKTWENLYEKFDSEKQLSTGLISGCKEIMQVRNTVRRLMVRCENISETMEMVVSRLTDAENSRSEYHKKKITKQPDLLNKEFKLQPYQLIGLSWLRVMHEQKVNGILADEMGLGKTIQAISFIAHMMEHGEQGPHVIIVPSSTIENWLRELHLWCPTLKVIVYYGSQEERRAVRHSIFFQGEEFNVLLTTYNMATGGVEDRVLFKKFEFHYAVFDEGHMLKNMSSLRFQNLMKIAANRRLLLTGTPLQNNLLELMSLLCFVMPEIFEGKTDHLKRVFAMITKSEDKRKSRFERDRIAQAKRIMKPFVLRRLKKDVLAQLPRKTERIERCNMLPEQQELYDGLVARYSQQFSDDNEENSGSGAGVFMQFRKAANHPLLMRNLYTNEKLKKMAKKIAKEPSHRDRGALPELIQEDMAVMNDFELNSLCKHHKKHIGEFILDPSVMLDSGKFRVLDRLLPEMKEKEDRVLLFSQFTMMLDVVEVYMEQRGYKYLRLDGQTPVPDRLQLIDKFNNEPDIFVFLLSTRAGGLGINLTAANTIILHDIDFNPYNDKQAEDRCHRLGQKKEVHIVKLISTDTVDEVILRCANDKLALEQDLTGPNNEDSEEDIKDVASLLKEVLKAGQQKKMADTSQNSNIDGGSAS